MTDEDDEDALLDRVAKGLQAIRRDAELARSAGVEGIAAAVARTEAEVRGLAAGVEALRQRGEQQQGVIIRLTAAAEKSEAELQRLQQAVAALSLHAVPPSAEAPAEMFPEAPVQKPQPHAAALIGIALAVLIVTGGAAAWIASGREPTATTLAHQAASWVFRLTGVDLGETDQPVPPVAAAPRTTPNPEPTAPSSTALSATARSPAAPSPTAPSAIAASPETPVALAAPAVAVPIAGPVAPVAATPPAQAEAPPVAAPPPAAQPVPAMASPPPPSPEPPVTPTQAAAQPVAQPESPAPAPPVPEPPHPTPAPRHLTVRATADAWVQVRQKGGRVLLNRTMKAGETWLVPGEPDLLLDTGNAGGVELDVDGTPLRLIGAKGSVVRDVVLDVNLLAASPARPPH